MIKRYHASVPPYFQDNLGVAMRITPSLDLWTQDNNQSYESQRNGHCLRLAGFRAALYKSDCDKI